MLSVVPLMMAAAAFVSQSELEAGAKACSIALSPGREWRAKLSADGKTVLASEYEGQQAENHCLRDWAEEKRVTFIVVRE